MIESSIRTNDVRELAVARHKHFVHPKAEVSPVGEVVIGQRTRIWQFASVIRGTVLGDDCNVAHGACLDGPKFGDRCIISHNVAMGPGFVIGDDVFIGPGVVFCNDMWPSTSKDGWSLETFQHGAVTIHVGNKVIVGANATILPGVRIGDGAVIAAGAVVHRDVPMNTVFSRKGALYPAPEKRKRMHILDEA